MHPVLFQVTDSFFIGTYGLMIALGLLAGIWLGGWRAQRRGFPPEVIFDLAFVAVVGGFVCARVLYILLEWDEFLKNPRALLFSRTGFVFLGGFLGAAGCTAIYLRKKKLPFLVIADIAVPSVSLAHAFGRIGCHLAGCCWGGLCQNEAIGIHLSHHETPSGLTLWNAYDDQLYRGLLGTGAGESLAVWPVQLMESAALFALTAVLVWYSWRPRASGRTLALYLFAYSLLRFGLEYLRGDAERGLWLGGHVST
ncbi:prolipoprotein diacylglyceryl transferase, partial [Candidatus Poribacteria bacterium]|nr:prolipoprotein diacylglyceryl transferase [Candidatus Poribacteria bacterium]